MRLERKYEAEAAHQLSAGVPEGHPCRRLHGHRYVITVTVIGDLSPADGMLLEYAEIDRRVQEVLGFVDHRITNFLGEEVAIIHPVSGVPTLQIGPILNPLLRERELAAKVRENSTVEHLANWFKAELAHRFHDVRKVGGLLKPQVYAVRIEEDSRSVVEV